MLAKDHRARARKAIKRQLPMLLITTFIYEVICVVIGFIPLVGGVVALLCQGPLLIGYIYLLIKASRNGNVDIKDLLHGLSNFLNGFLLHLLNGIFIALWSLLFIIPGIMKAYSYSMSYFLISDNPGMDQGRARAESMRMMEGRRMELFTLHLSFIGWYILAALISGAILTPFAYLLQYNPYLYSMISSVALLIPAIFLIPYIGVATASFYNELVGGSYQDDDVAYVDDGFAIKHDDYDADDFFE